MAFDQNIRNRLARFVTDARTLLTEQFTRQLQRTYGIDPTSGEVTAVDRLTGVSDAERQTAELLRETAEHYLPGFARLPAKSRRDTIERIVREQAFTVLNRLCALRMAEARGLLIESVAAGYQSRGLQLYARLAGAALGETGDAYRTYLFSLFDEFAIDLPVLFDRFAPEGRLFPGETVLLALLDLVNHPEIEPLWTEDETIGWIYQYFNSKEERKAMRDASAAPRNSRELAVRNQFFTPRYVVEFLTDNTLGRIWYEMTQGETSLKESCRYLVRRPSEIFLAVGESAPHPPTPSPTAGGRGEAVPKDADSEQDRWDVSPALKARMTEVARQFRKEPTRSEDILWQAIRGKQLDGRKFRRQQPIGPFVVDFFCSSERLVVEVDGPIHEQQRASDQQRQELLESLGLRVVRISAGTVEHRLDDALTTIRRAFSSNTNPPLPGVGEGAGGEGENLSQEELLKQPVYIPHRTLKDPRAITMLDPACGSMHFGLYAFDLFERIYDEAWELEGERGPKALERAPMDAPLHEAYLDKDSFLRDVPRLIVERNIHGVDIDPRAVQIAGLSLWLRAQKSWREQNLKPQDRPQIKRSNVVCAEPMPGDKDLLEEFIARHLSGNAEDKVVAWMLRKVFDAMALAGEAGTLLKIEDEITAIVAEAKRQWRQGPKLTQSTFFADEAERITQRALGLDASGITDATFWTRAEERIDVALKDYAAFAEGEGAYRRRLFAGDAVRGFAFIDLCRKRYDVVLMNPPFGMSTRVVFEQLQKQYKDTYVDLYACFVARGLQLAHQGLVGAITSRAFLMTKKLSRWRLNQVSPSVDIILDLGIGVMDDAFVEAAAYTLRMFGTSEQIIAVDRRNQSRKDNNIQIIDGHDIHVVRRSEIMALPGQKLLYQLPLPVFALLRDKQIFEPQIGTAREGLRTFDDFRFVRLRWETPLQNIGAKEIWEPFAKGGEYAKYYSDLHLLVKWNGGGEELSEVNRQVNGQVAQARQASDYYRKHGATYSKRSVKGFSARALPSGCVIGTKGPAVLSESDVEPSYIVGWLNCSLIISLIHVQANAYEFNTGIIKRLPWRYPTCAIGLARITQETIETIRRYKREQEINSCFVTLSFGETLGKIASFRQSLSQQVDHAIADCQSRWDEALDSVYGLSSFNLGVQEEGDTDEADDDGEVEEEVGNHIDVAQALTSYTLGCVLGRWDIRYATGERPAPELPDPFAPLPVCPPGMLQNEEGLPAAPGDVPSSYPLRISWPGILVDDEGHPEDIERRGREAILVMWGERAEAIEQEACEILGVRLLREYFRKPALFFADHLQRYSKSRRQAPIYWPLSTPSGSYTLWLYYHRLTDQTLYSCVNDFVEPKLTQVSEQAAALRRKSGRTGKEEKELERLADLEQELQDLRAELLRVAAFWKPNLNDGVQITAAPLWKLFQHKPWQKRLKETWEKLEDGEYDWAHLAYSIWPERVRAKCKSDKSLAIAHDLEALYVEPSAGTKKKGRGKRATEDEGMFGEE